VTQRYLQPRPSCQKRSPRATSRSWRRLWSAYAVVGKTGNFSCLRPARTAMQLQRRSKSPPKGSTSGRQASGPPASFRRVVAAGPLLAGRWQMDAGGHHDAPASPWSQRASSFPAPRTARSSAIAALRPSATRQRQPGEPARRKQRPQRVAWLASARVGFCSTHRPGPPVSEPLESMQLVGGLRLTEQVVAF
jgi:hypothetical protein